VSIEGEGVRAFWRAWRQLERRGACDSWGGAECLRIYRVWLRAGRPWPVKEFIAKKANISSEGRNFLERWKPGPN
jgi:hypothetical protein